MIRDCQMMMRHDELIRASLCLLNVSDDASQPCQDPNGGTSTQSGAWIAGAVAAEEEAAEGAATRSRSKAAAVRPQREPDRSAGCTRSTPKAS